MNTQHTRNIWLVALVAGAAGMGLIPSAVAGPINPPAGPVASTYKTLTQVEPRKDVAELSSGGGALYQITTAGSYYLTANITPAAGQSGINVTADNVTIDLNGFSIMGNAGAAGHGVNATLRTNVAVVNGTVRNMAQSGVYCFNSVGCRFENLVLSNNAEGLNPGKHSTVTNVKAIDNTVRGFSSVADQAVIYRECSAKTSAASAVGFSIQFDTQIINCEVSGGGNGIFGSSSNLLDGAHVASVSGAAITLGSNCRVLHSHAGASVRGIIIGDQSLIEDCTIVNNTETTSAGITAGASVTITHTQVQANSGGGILFTGGGGSVTGCNIYGNTGVGIAGNSNLGGFIIESNTVNNNAARGISISLGSIISNNVVRNNTLDGIYVGVACRVTSNLLDANGAAANQQAGILTDGSANFIADNFVNSNDVGIWCSTQGGNIVIRNICRGNGGGNYLLFANTLNGAIVTTPSTADATSNYSY